MEGSPYQKFSISWKGTRFQGPNSGFLLAGTWSVPLSGTRGSGSCLEAGGNDTGVFFPNSLPLISRFCHQSQGITCALKSTGVAHSQHAPLRQDPDPLILLSWVRRKPELIQNLGEDRFLHSFVHPLFKKMNFDLPTSLVGGRVKRCRLFADPLSSPVASFREVSETDSEVIPMAPLKQCGSFVLDDGPCSEIQEQGLKVIQRKYGIHSSVQMRSPLEFEHASDGGTGEIAIFDAYLIAGFRGIVPSLVAEVSSFLGFCPSQLTPLSWKTLMSIQVLGELYGLDTGVHEVLYSYYFAPLTIMPGFYHLQPRDGAPLVEEPSRGTRGNYPFGDNWTSRCVLSGIHSWGSSGEKDVSNPSTFPWSALPDEQGGDFAGLPAPVLYDEYQQAGTRRRHPFYSPPPRLTRATSPAARIKPLPSWTVTGDAPLMGVRQRLLTELFLLRNRVRDSARLELMKEWLEGRTSRRDPEEEYCRYLLCSEGSDHHFGGCPKVDSRSAVESRGPYSAILGEATTGTCWDFTFYLSEAGHYRVPVLHAAFCRKPLSDLEGAGVGENPSARLYYFPRLEK
ncbi:hypothetical protein IGI04_022694 [Brassica rapa subsp. trilocularis]|uniref:Uncharacterized protein n=1 Tax=Brassica rapa subsp. trilocularis TaxID=1813537 RepID=A0ABQ7M1N5_BRACM|nr:hypothetical protein IGI04_022694 [Brassica rapa subsp. trilocularis]